MACKKDSRYYVDPQKRSLSFGTPRIPQSDFPLWVAKSNSQCGPQFADANPLTWRTFGQLPAPKPLAPVPQTRYLLSVSLQ